MKLTKEQIQSIDDFLIKNKIKFIDVRLELIDHLATEFEQESKLSLLEDFLCTKKQFIKTFKKKRQKTVHWSYQRQLWTRFFMFFYKPNYLVYTILTGVIIYASITFLNPKASFIFCGLSLTIPLFISVFSNFKYEKPFKKIQSAQSVFGIMSLPSLFLFSLNVLKDSFIENAYLFAAYWFIGFLLNVSGVLEVKRRKAEIIDKYKSFIKI